eukprot:CAMPEP_0196132168 /NCGR_PEP_ID=MMETSP0910-20130528/1895_1 /TAXON_ID=49265 /ORGANISM="Thalassiosira rotula, Strain GSO102" /LENGTH=775 /DNA_ID=CAMNT_0041391735 /DNA_START=78 /DNA_END=2405 /DNA_ORIENTATION=+
MASSAASPTSVREVDYYLNPTELFRWINYRRWDGAKSRANSHPDECSTWIVSRHNTDGRILWRHLPLHLICMQKEAACGVLDESDVQAVVANRQMEQLMDVLLDSYPEGASSPDDQGMLPLHLLLSKAEGEPNERVINLLLSSFPNAVDIRDKFGRTPYDILRESCGSTGTEGTEPGPGDANTSDRCRAAFRALKRARYVADRITSTIRDESANIVAAVQHEASNERGASQKIIVRLEEEMSKTRKEMEARDARERGLQDDIRRMKSELSMTESNVSGVSRDLAVTRKERDELLSSNEAMKVQLDSHNEVVERTRREATQNRNGDLELIANLKSEVSTSKAMTEALESQLRSRFTNEEYLSTTVSELEEQLDELKVRHEHETKKNQHELEVLTTDNKKLKWNCEEHSKKNNQLQEKLKDLNKQMSQIISSYSTLNTEHDRLLELSKIYENNLLDTVRSERAQLVEHFRKQRETLEKTFNEQERIIEESLQSQDKFIATANSDRSRGKATVEKLRNEFQQLRAAAAERERTMHAEELAAARKMKRVSTTTSRKGDSQSISSSPTPSGESRNPHPTHSHHRSPPRSMHPSSSSTTADGHLVRLLDERAAAQSTPRRGELGVSHSSSGSESGVPPQYYKHHTSYQANGKVNPNPSPPMRRDHGPTIRGGGVPISKSVSGASTYAGRVAGVGSGGEYSLDEYSHDGGSVGSGRYSEASSQYSSEDPRRSNMDTPPSPPGGQHHHMIHPPHQQHHQWKHHEYGRNLQYVNESYGDESTNE